jgi:hypothetical protein
MINTGNLNEAIDSIIHRIETDTEEEIKADILEDAKLHEKAIMDNNYRSLLEYLKGDKWGCEEPKTTNFDRVSHIF